MKTVVATAKGYDNLALREAGDEFVMPDDAKGSWFKDVKADEHEEKRKPGRPPNKREKD